MVSLKNTCTCSISSLWTVLWTHQPAAGRSDEGLSRIGPGWAWMGGMGGTSVDDSCPHTISSSMTHVLQKSVSQGCWWYNDTTFQLTFVLLSLLCLGCLVFSLAGCNGGRPGRWDRVHVAGRFRSTQYVAIAMEPIWSRVRGACTASGAAFGCERLSEEWVAGTETRSVQKSVRSVGPGF